MNVDQSLPSYDKPPLEDITLDEFELFAIDRLRVLSEIESCHIRNRQPEETKKTIGEQCKKYLPLASGSGGPATDPERRKDHIGHFVLRLAFCQSSVQTLAFLALLLMMLYRDDLRRRFVKAESELFRFRYGTDVTDDRESFLKSQDFGWNMV